MAVCVKIRVHARAYTDAAVYTRAPVRVLDGCMATVPFDSRAENPPATSYSLVTKQAATRRFLTNELFQPFF